MDIVTIDFETYYGKDYSLTKQTTEEYIRDPRFEVIGLGVKLGDYPTTWYSGDRPDKFLSSLDFSNKAVLAHNCMFDAAVLSWHFGIKPARWLDTLSMARPVVGARTSLGLARLAEFFGLGAKGDEVYNAKEKRRADFTPEELERYAEYCVNDVDLTYQLYQRLVDGFPEDELRLIDMTIRMFAEPVFTLDIKILREHLGRLQTKKANALATLDLDDDVEDIRGTLMSNPKFAELLRSYGVEPPKKISTTTGRSTYAFSKTDSGFLELLNHDDERVKQAATARLETKSTLEETRTERFIGVAGRGPLPVALNYYGAHTGRFSGCLVGDTVVTVKEFDGTVTDKPIVDVLLDDLVWDGEEFVRHEGVKFSGFAEVIEWDGVKGTPDHVVFTDAGEISLREAREGGHYITAAPYIADD